ncbi:MAG: hypothetical protein GX303_07100 [Clostridiales bacterium]|nr:hypothetical protein [Clostridiales bacterium]
MSRISMMTLPGAGQTSEAGTAFYVMHRSAALKMINKYLNIYDLLISDSIFDKNIVFCNLNDNNLKSQYYKDVDWDKVVTADEPEIDIPLLGE